MKWFSFNILSIISVSVLLSGCNPDLDKTVTQTDKKAYDIIDKTWQNNSDDAKGDYRISDYNGITSDPNAGPSSAYIVDGILSLKNAVVLGLKNNREFQRRKEELYFTALDQMQTEHDFSSIFSGEVSSTYQNEEDVESVNTSAGVGVEKILATGARIGSNISLGCIDILSGDARSGVSVIASATITQPLLRGAGRKVALENITQAQRNTVYEIRNFNQYRKELVVEIISDYYNLLLLNEIRNNYMQYCQQMELLYNNLQIRADAGRIPVHELEQAHQDQIKAMSDLLVSSRDYEDALDDFKLKLSMPITVAFSLDMGELTALTESVRGQMQLTEEQAIELALDQRLDMLNAVDAALDAERKVEVAADAIRTELNLVGNASSQRALSPRSSRNDTTNGYGVGLEMDLPFDRLAEKNAYRQALIEIESAKRNQQELSDVIAIEVRKDFRKLDESKEKFNNENNGLELAKKRSSNTESLLRYGRANTRDILDAQGDLLDASNGVAQAMVEYAIANMQLLKNTGIIKIKSDSSWDTYRPVQSSVSQNDAGETNL